MLSTGSDVHVSLATLADVKQYLGLSTTNNDTLLQTLLDSISLQIERYTAKRFEPNPPFVDGADTNSPVEITVNVGMPPAATVPFASPGAVILGDWPRSGLRQPVEVTIPHARAITAVTWGDTAVDATQYATRNDLTLQDPFVRRLIFHDPALQPVDTVTVTGRFGIEPVPADLVDAVLQMTARTYKQKDALYSDTVLLPDGAVVNYFKQFGPYVEGIVKSYCELGA